MKKQGQQERPGASGQGGRWIKGNKRRGAFVRLVFGQQTYGKKDIESTPAGRRPFNNAPVKAGKVRGAGERLDRRGRKKRRKGGWVRISLKGGRVSFK